MNHDELFKELLLNFFPEFLQLFFPVEAAGVDLSTVRFLSQEAFTDFPDGTLRRADLIAEVRTRSGAIGIILIHIEIQAERERDVPFRMWEYFSLLRHRYHHPIFPIVLYLAPGSGGLTVERYNETVLGRQVLAFEYAVIGLPDLSAEEYEARGMPLATALASLMRSTTQDRIERKYQSLKRVIGSGLDEARQLLLATIVQRYQRLSVSQEKTLEARLQQEEPGAMSIYTIIREDGKQEGLEQGLEQGIQQGIEQGILRGQRETLLRQLRARFGEISDAVVALVEAISSPEEMEELLLRVLTAGSLAEMGFTE